MQYVTNMSQMGKLALLVTDYREALTQAASRTLRNVVVRQLDQILGPEVSVCVCILFRSGN